MARTGQTVSEEGDVPAGSSRAAVPGLVIVFSNGKAELRAAPCFTAGIELGRGPFAGQVLDDERMSRSHATVRREGAAWTVEDHGSHNGTFVDGERVTGKVNVTGPRVVRVGRSLFMPVNDVRRFVNGSVERSGDAVVGPTLRAAWTEVERAARFGDVVSLSGESGVGKEIAARAFHAFGPHPAGPFIAVNCAAIPEGLAERLLFGARRGAYSGANADADGYVQAADGGTLFLDEVGDLDAAVQAKLLRALEAKEVMPLGASRARSVEVRVVSATRDLRGEVAGGRFREDLYFRIGRPEVAIPALRDRLEELPWLVAAELARTDRNLVASVMLVEACLLRTWPGNVRELLAEVRRAASMAIGAGRTSVGADDLSSNAGMGFVDTKKGDAAGAAPGPGDRASIERALRECDGNVTRAARALGMHRNQLRRWLTKYGDQAQNLAPGGADDEPEEPEG